MVGKNFRNLFIGNIFLDLVFANILPLSKIVGCQTVGHFSLMVGHHNDNNTDVLQSSSLCAPDHFEGQPPLFLPEIDAKILP